VHQVTVGTGDATAQKSRSAMSQAEARTGTEHFVDIAESKCGSLALLTVEIAKK
jgi:hypothetical protein